MSTASGASQEVERDRVPHDTGRVSVGFVGLGQIGTPMARRLDDPLVYDVNPAATEGFSRVASSIDELSSCDVVCVMVRDDEQVRSVVAALAGPVIAVHSTISVETAVSLGDRALDAPVSGGPMGAEEGRLAVMVGGSPEAFAIAEPVLKQLGDLVVHLGPAGAGTKAKLARNLLHFAAFTAAGEAARLAEAAGIDPAVLGEVVRHSDAVTGGPGAIMWRDSAGPLTADDGWRSIFEHVATLGEKDLRYALALGDSLDVDLPLAGLALDRLRKELGL